MSASPLIEDITRQFITSLKNDLSPAQFHGVQLECVVDDGAAINYCDANQLVIDAVAAAGVTFEEGEDTEPFFNLCDLIYARAQEVRYDETKLGGGVCLQ